MSDSTNTNKIFRILIYVAMCVPLIVYSWYVQKFALDIPRQDDYDAILKFLSQYKVAGGSDRLALLFSQQNEHRILMSRIVYVLYYSLFHTINFRHIILLNIGVLAGVFAFMLYFVRKALPTMWPLAGIVLSMCVFDINGFENADFAMAGMQNYGILLLFLGSLYYYDRDKPALLPLAILLQVVATYSSGNGILASGIIMLCCLSGGIRRNKIAAVATTLVFSPLYYLHYVKPGNDFFSANPSKFMPYFLRAIGAHFSGSMAMMGGVAILVALAFLLPADKRDRKRPGVVPFMYIMLFLVASMGIMALFRAKLPLEFAYSSRYFIYSNMIMAILFVFLLLKLQERELRLRLAITGMATAAMLFMYIRNYNEGKGGFGGFHLVTTTTDYDYPNKEVGKQLTDEACRLNIYCIEDHRIK